MAVVLAESTPSILRLNFDEECKFFPSKMTKPVKQPLTTELETS